MNEFRPNKATVTMEWHEIYAFFRSIWRLGILGEERWEYWKLFFWTLFTHPNQFPLLERMGRGRFRLELPADIPLDVDFRGGEGALSLNMSGLALERLNMDLPKGNALVTLPAYQPLGARGDALLGTFVVREGDITVFVPQTVGVHFELNRGGSGLLPTFNALDYNYLVGDILEARTFDSAQIKLRYGITAPRGQISIAPSATQ